MTIENLCHDCDSYKRVIAERDELAQALKEAADCLIYAAQEGRGKVKAEIVGGWIHHSNKARAALAKVKGE